MKPTNNSSVNGDTVKEMEGNSEDKGDLWHAANEELMAQQKRDSDRKTEVRSSRE